MNTLDVIQITALAATLLNVVLTVLVLSRDFRSTLHRVYLGWGISVTLWNLGVYHLSQKIGYEEAFAWAKVLQLGVIFMPVTLFHLCWVIAQGRVKWVMPVLYLIHTGFAISLLRNEFIIGVRLLDVGYWTGFQALQLLLHVHHRGAGAVAVSQAKRGAANATDPAAGAVAGHCRFVGFWNE
jgi:hypothetical protein